jgi:chloramphenicol 3-O phosphotransferase
VIIWLNGTSSAGKSTLAVGLQAAASAPLLHTGIDHFLDAFPKRFYGIGDERPSDWFTPTVVPGNDALQPFNGSRLGRVEVGEAGHRFLRGMYRAIAALAQSGLDVIVDDVVYTDTAYADAVHAFAGLNLLRVAVRCPVDIAEQRELARGDRLPGGASFFNYVHDDREYDLEVDTSVRSVAESVAVILEVLPVAFRR